MHFDLKDCLEQGLIRKIPPSEEKAFRSLEKARIWLQEAEKTLEAKAYNSSVICSYLAMFHGARGILFHDGYREKSHFCVARYLEDEYVTSKLLERKWVDLFDYYRDLRQQDQYDVGTFVTQEEAKKAMESAELFVERMENLFKDICKE